MVTRLSPAWQRSAAQPAAAVSAASTARPPFRRVPLVAAGESAHVPSMGAGMPPSRPTPPVDWRPLPPEPPRRPLELAWLTWQMPARHQEAIIFNLRQTLDWRAQHCQPLAPPETPPAYTRFGLIGEQLWPYEVGNVGRTLNAELRETIRTVEATQSRTERNRLLAMHSVRLGQLCGELEQRELDTLEPVRSGLLRLWE